MILDDASVADFALDGQSYAVVRISESGHQLEYPAGTVLYRTAGWIGEPRVSPSGDLVAFVDHPSSNDDGGAIAVVDRTGNERKLSQGWISAQGLAWGPDGREVWFTATREGASRALHAVSLGGRERALLRVPGVLRLHDLSRDGQVLVARENQRMGIAALRRGDIQERDLSWLDYSLVDDLSEDGEWIIFSESGEAAGSEYSVYLRRTDGSLAVRLGQGATGCLSPDGKWVAVTTGKTPKQLVLLPIGTGEPRALPSIGIHHQRAVWFPDGKRLLIWGNEPGRELRCFVRNVEGGPALPVSPEGMSHLGTTPTFSKPVSPDGSAFVAGGPDGTFAIYDVEGGVPRPISGIGPNESPVRWAEGGASLFIRRNLGSSVVIERLDLESGRREPCLEISHPASEGYGVIHPLHLTADGKAYAYSHEHPSSELYLVEGLR